MGDIILDRWALAGAVGAVVAVGFDGLLHGLSRGGHGILDQLWHREQSERESPTAGPSAIGWHVLVDVVLGIVLATLVALAAPLGLAEAAAVGALVGLCQLVVWGHVYASLEVRAATALSLGGLAVIQGVLVGLAVGLTYPI